MAGADLGLVWSPRDHDTEDAASASLQRWLADDKRLGKARFGGSLLDLSGIPSAGSATARCACSTSFAIPKIRQLRPRRGARC
jgi:hypothetical protein